MFAKVLITTFYQSNLSRLTQIGGVKGVSRKNSAHSKSIIVPIVNN